MSTSFAYRLVDPAGSYRIAARVRGLMCAFLKARIAHRDKRRLMEMTDDQLKDIGIGRSQIDRAVRYGRN